MATIYIHIGAPKTATSTLQSVLSGNYSKLLKHGVLYPRDFRNGDAHHLLVCDLIEKVQGNHMPDIWYGSKPRGEAWAALRAEIAGHGSSIHSVILSSELFFGQSNKIQSMLEEVSTQLQGHDVRVVVYLRRQDQLYSSFYNQDVKGVRQWPDSAYQFYQTHQIFQQNYYNLLNAWSEVFGKVHMIIRPFESEQWVNGDIVQDFCAVTGTVLLPSGYKDHNESLGSTQLYLKICMNKIGFDKGTNEDLLDVLLKIYPEEPLKGCSYVNKALYRRYRQQWLRVNRTISQEYLNGDTLFHKDIPVPEDLDIYQVDKSRLADFIREMVRLFSKGKYPGYRALFTRATLLAMAEQDLWHVLEAPDRELLLSWI
jgi:hypothetical protein